MDLLKNIFWHYPAALQTSWTLLVLLLAWTLPLNRCLPFFTPPHVLLLLNNPKDAFLHRRPTLLAGLGFLVAGALPGISFVLLLLHTWLCARHGYLARRSHRSRQSRKA